MKFILVRHGETDYNKEKKIQGLINNLLNDSGRRQARNLRMNFVNEKIDVCYVSPLVRCVETAMIFGEIYRHAGEWKFRAVGQGYAGGLHALCVQHGVSVQ